MPALPLKIKIRNGNMETSNDKMSHTSNFVASMHACWMNVPIPCILLWQESAKSPPPYSPQGLSLSRDQKPVLGGLGTSYLRFKSSSKTTKI